MSPSDPPQPRLPSLADYLVRHDLKTMIEEAKQDYTQASAGTPRLLNQKDIAARFRKAAPPAPKPGTP